MSLGMSDKEEVEFHRGMLAALAVVASFDEETIYQAIVNTTDENLLIQIARRDGSMRWSGLSRYRYGRKEQL